MQINYLILRLYSDGICANRPLLSYSVLEDSH